MKKILFVSGDITRCGGTECVGMQIMNALAALPDYHVSVVSLFEKETAPFFILSEKIQRFKLFDSPISLTRKYLSAIFRLRRLILEEHFDVVVDIDVILSLISLPATYGTSVKVYSWEHFHFYENLGCKLRTLARWVIRRYADGIIVLTQADQKNYESAGTKVPIFQIYNPIPKGESSVFYDANSKLILSVGRLTFQKGFDRIPQIAAKVFDRHPDWTWIIVGEGEDRAKIESEIAKYHLEAYVKLVGKQDAHLWYSKAAFYVMTSRFEGFGLVLTEALSHYVPCITFDCPYGPSEIIEDGQNGYVVQPGEFAIMAEKINMLIEDPSLREKMSSNTVPLIQKFSMESIIHKWEKIFCR